MTCRNASYIDHVDWFHQRFPELSLIQDSIDSKCGNRTADFQREMTEFRYMLTQGTAALVANLLNRAERGQVAEFEVCQHDELLWRNGWEA